MSHPVFRKARAGRRWDEVEVLDYKPEGSAPFLGISRQLLFRTEALGCELRYFEIGPGGHSTLERHEHEHAVLILSGGGACLVGNEVRAVGTHDLVHIPALSWHQFRASEGGHLGFLCMVNVDRDRPRLPGPEDLAELRRDPKVAAFIRP
ncbi:cupin domain-containing protein [Pseudothauera rhizosphaerae]|uniref:Cupin domain-containing protein n=1 Tax=Pseudothauera rhizosphaerae TaxID=2565932 RepID=A0A4S4ANS7_9RHOO|nr:cupin domain-containing protein [Pseudothauera rhizosphaerae]THF61242.1 cupin domain-containing protein [Pseudothauera rhizosphaerae]